MPLIRGRAGGSLHNKRSSQFGDCLSGTGSAETAMPDVGVCMRSGGSMRLGLREAASVALAASISGLVWLPNVPSVVSAISVAILVCTLVVELARNQEKLSISTVDWLVMLFVAVRVFALWNEPQDLGGFDAVVSLVVSLAVFLSMALPRWDDRLARRVMATFTLSATVVAAVHWWLSRGYVAVAGSNAIEVELLARGINRNEFGQLLAVAVILAFLFIRLSRRNGARRLFWTAILVFDLAFLVVLGSRASLAMGLFGLLANLIIERPQYAYWVAAALACMAALLPRSLAWISSMGAAAPETLIRGAALVQALMTGDTSQIAVASAGRVPIWQAGLASFASSPIWGVGEAGARSMMLQRVGIYAYAHSTLIILLAESGLVGAIVYYACCLVLAGRLIRLVREGHDSEKHIVATLLACELAILITGVFAVTGLDKIAFMLLGLGTALVSRRIREKHGGNGAGASPTDAEVSAKHSNRKSRGAGAGPEEAM
jgi:O-antigen ligase